MVTSLGRRGCIVNLMQTPSADGVCALMAYVLPGCKYLISLVLDIIMIESIAIWTDNFDHGQKS